MVSRLGCFLLLVVDVVVLLIGMRLVLNSFGLRVDPSRGVLVCY